MDKVFTPLTGTHTSYDNGSEVISTSSEYIVSAYNYYCYAWKACDKIIDSDGSAIYNGWNSKDTNESWWKCQFKSAKKVYAFEYTHANNIYQGKERTHI